MINFFDPQEMKKALDLPENEEVVMMLDLGYGNQKEPLPNHHLKKNWLKQLNTYNFYNKISFACFVVFLLQYG